MKESGSKAFFYLLQLIHCHSNKDAVPKAYKEAVEFLVLDVDFIIKEDT